MQQLRQSQQNQNQHNMKKGGNNLMSVTHKVLDHYFHHEKQ